MTHDELIEAVGRAIDGVFNDAGLRGLLEHEGIPPQSLARAAIRVIAPAVLGDAEQRCRYVAKHNYDRQEEGPYRDGFEIACEVCETSIRSLKPRYEQ